MFHKTSLKSVNSMSITYPKTADSMLNNFRILGDLDALEATVECSFCTEVLNISDAVVRSLHISFAVDDSMSSGGQ